MKTAKHVPHGEAGFTLLELLISLSIFALIMVALASGVHFAGRAWRAQESRNVQQGDVQSVQSVLRQMIASGQDFEGNSAGMKFVGKPPAALARAGLFDIEIELDDGKLRLSWKPHFKGISIKLERHEAVLLDGVVTAGFSYYFESQNWQSATKGQSKPLQLIAIQAQLAGGRIWSPFVVAPALTVPIKPKT